MISLILFLCLLKTVDLTSRTINDYEKIFNYMKRFGYIDPNPDAIVMEEQFKDGLKLMQKFGHIQVTGVLDEETKALIETPRCGMKDIENLDSNNRKRRESNPPYVLNGICWKKKSITYYIHNSTESLERSKVENLLQKALQVWQQACYLNFTKVGEESEADMIFTFYSGAHPTPNVTEKDFDGPGGVLAHVSTPKTNESTLVYVHFDDDETWVDDSDQGKSCNDKGIGFFTVAVHEVGHALGLNHNFFYGSIMNPYFKNNKANAELSYAEALAMYDLYGKGISEVSKPNPIDYPPVPPSCEGYFDSALIYYDELYLFKEKVVWRIWNDKLVGGRAFWIQEIFRFPSEIEKIDAAYQRRTDGSVIFFTGNRYWIFDYIYPLINESLPISTLGFPVNTDSIDAAMVWSDDGKTYFFKDSMYWSYNEVSRKMEDGYPHSLSTWKYVSPKLDAVASFRNGTTYFFKDKNYWEIGKHGYIVNTKSWPKIC